MSFAVRTDGTGWRAVDDPTDCGPDERWQGDVPASPAQPPQPQSVTAVQAFAALDQAGHLAQLMAYLDAPDTPPLVRAVVMGATEWRRDSLMLMNVAIVLGFTSAQVDDLFQVAQTIEL